MCWTARKLLTRPTKFIEPINKDQLVGYRAAETAGELITAPFHNPERITLIANLPRGVSAELNRPGGERVTGFEHADGGSALENGVIVFAKSLSEFAYDRVRLRIKYADGIV